LTVALGTRCTLGVRLAAGLLIGCVAMLGSRSANAQVAPVGNQFQVNTITAGSQFSPAMASDAAGDFVVVWKEPGIQAQRYDVTGTPLGGQFQVNSYTTGYPDRPAVAVDPMGNFVVAWQGYGSPGTDTSGYSIQARRFDATGAPLGAQFQVNSITTDSQRRPAVGVDATGNFVVTWRSGNGNPSSIRGQRYDAAGVPLGGEFQVNSVPAWATAFPAIAVDGTGAFVVVWNAPFTIQARRYDASGAPLGGEFQVNTDLPQGAYGLGGARIAMDGAANFIVVWDGNGLAGSDPDLGIQARRFDASGTPLGPEFQVNSYTSGGQSYPDVDYDALGNFIVTWDSFASPADHDAGSVHAQRFDAAGAPLGGQFQVNSYTSGGQGASRILVNGSGNFTVAWVSQGSAGSDFSGTTSIQAQRFQLGVPIRILGRSLTLRNPSGDEPQRTIVAQGQETPTDIGPAVIGDPTISGATLRIIASGTMNSDETFVLDAAGWRPFGGYRARLGYLYLGPTGADGDPVRKVLLNRTPQGKALFKVILRGTLGTQDLDVVPPNQGIEGVVVLTINGGGSTYCMGFGGAAGGTETRDDAGQWRISSPSAEDCPIP
jgi:hypothetical protein